ncbi:MAG TPA: type II toxin-antitoxin system VapC family toxin [Gemmataceae bacterium]|nr:type II toxin-antitoxin system VapC family toxin [Gemmataceae bacterium]
MSVPSPPALLDTAIPMYAAGAPHTYRNACQWVMTQIASGRLQAVIDAEVIQEVLHRYGALGRYADAVNVANDLMMIVPQVLPITVTDMQTAVTLFQQYAPRGMRARDAIHAAIMQNHGLTHIISTDGHFDLVAGLTGLDPIILYQTATQPGP